MVELKTGLVKNFNVGFARTNNSYANYSCLLPDGRVASESLGSFLIFNPLAENRQRAPVTISGFSDGINAIPFLSSGQEIKLKSSQNYFTVNFASLNLLENKDVQFAYKLEGANDDWVYCRNQQTAYFTNVTGGKYVFKVKMQNPDGSWTESPAGLKIDVAKKILRDCMVPCSLLVLALVACGIWYLRLFRKKLLKNESDKAIAYFANSLQGKVRSMNCCGYYL
ncbi:MAG: hypothetical protein IPP38_10670 [Bacteroidetes bacterium]|nr:hypothetical protein [Bacteroidota bacterium]